MGVAASLSVRLSANTSELTRAFADVSNEAKKVGSGLAAGLEIPSLATLGKSLVGAAAGFATFSAAVAGIEAVGRALSEVIDTASRLTDLGAKTAISVRELQRLEYAGAQVGVSLDTVATAATQLQKRLAGDDKGAAAAVAELGLNINTLLGMGAGQQFEAIATALGRMTDPARQTFLAMEIFGRGGAALLPLLRSDMTKLGDEIERLGLMSDGLVANADSLGDTWTKLTIVGRNLVAQAFAPMIDSAAKLFDILQNPGTAIEIVLAGLDVKGLLPAWRELKGYVGAVFGSDNSPTLPGAPKGFGAPNMAGLPTMGDPKEALKLFEESEKKAKQASDEWKRFTDSVSGRDRIADAQKWMRAVQEIGGVTHLTADNQKRFNDVLGDALRAYAALGKVAPDAMARVWAATIPPPAFVTGIQSLKDVGTLMAVPVPPLPPLAGGPGSVSGLGSLPGTQVPIGSAKLPGFLEQMFGGSKGFGANISSVIMGALTGGGGVGKSIGGLLGGDAFKGITGKLAGMLGSKGIGGALGGVLGSVLPGLGNILGSLGGSAISGLIGKLFGGEKKKTNQARDAFIEQSGGLDALKKSAEAANFSLDKLLSTKKVKDFQSEVGKLNAAMDAQKAKMEAIGDIAAGVNARASVFGQKLSGAEGLSDEKKKEFAIGSHDEFNRIGTMAAASFALQLQTAGSAVAALAAMEPTLAVLTQAQGQFNFVATDTVARLLEMNAVVAANRLEFDALGASGQILQAMLQGNIRDGSLFAAVATDIGTQIQTVIDRGVPMAQVFALAQPQLQALWEAQQKWGFAVDATTQGLIDEAAAQGFVGAQMKDVNEQILDVLLAIGRVLGADIPEAFAGLPGAAQSAADGINAAFDSVNGPRFGDNTMEAPDIPAMASGGIVRRPTLALIGEAGPEAVVPLNGAFNGGGGGTVIIELDGRNMAEVVVPHIPGVVTRYGLA